MSNKLAYTELIIALASAVGTDNSILITELEKQLADFNYTTEVIKISKHILEPRLNEPTNSDAYKRTTLLMNKGNELREKNGTSILAQGVAYEIARMRRNNYKDNNKGIAYIIDSLKHEDEVNKLKEIYTSSFYLFTINETESDREEYLEQTKNIGGKDARALISRDAEETLQHGQHTKVVFQLADFHLSTKGWRKNLPETPTKNYKKLAEDAKRPIVSTQLTRILDLMFGNPYITPTFDEYAMFMAYASSLRSADLSRQVGAVIAKTNEIIATGANDVPAFRGGQYWPGAETIEYRPFDDETGVEVLSKVEHRGYDQPNGRDHTWKLDPNKKEIQIIIEEIVDSFDYSETKQLFGKTPEQYKKLLTEQLQKSPLKYLTEFSRAVHAEMAAMLSCARTGVSIQDSTLYCTTFPCHNCARHAIFAGIKRVVFIEPYLKSKAISLHKDSITITDESDKVRFEQFIGVGPRRFFDLFSLKLSTGRDIIRKQEDKVISYRRANARLRCEMPVSLYQNIENKEALEFSTRTKKDK